MKAPTDAGHNRLFIGLMSGTSVDGIDSVIIETGGETLAVVASRQHPIPDPVGAEIAALSHPTDNEIERLGRLDRTLGHLFADAALALLQEAGLGPGAITAIGSHGQTIRHAPPTGTHDQHSFTLQIGDPNTIAERCGITTVADFRRRDIAAGGEGAPLAPAFHAAAFTRSGVNRAIVNIGGIANVSLLEGKALRAGFDSGPGNTLLDHWYRRHHGDGFDLDGRWAASGRIVPSLLQALLQDAYFTRSGPRSTGKEHFHMAWLERCLDAQAHPDASDIQATLAELTARTIANPLLQAELPVDEIYVCGGGAHNKDLLRRLAARLHPAPLATTTELGIHPDWVEAAAFAWLAQQRLDALAGNAEVVTGASGQKILGGIYAP